MIVGKAFSAKVPPTGKQKRWHVIWNTLF